MRASLVLLVVLGACATAETSSGEPEGPTITLMSDSPAPEPAPADEDIDVCALAATLPADDICSLVCDPDALKAQLVADGTEPGTCIQLYCQLTDTVHVLAGVCIAPQ